MSDRKSIYELESKQPDKLVLSPLSLDERAVSPVQDALPVYLVLAEGRLQPLPIDKVQLTPTFLVVALELTLVLGPVVLHIAEVPVVEGVTQGSHFFVVEGAIP